MYSDANVIAVTLTVLFVPAFAFSNANVPVAVGVSLFTAPLNVIEPVAVVVPSYTLLSAVAVTVSVLRSTVNPSVAVNPK